MVTFDSPYQGYLYSYPHKTAYGQLPLISLAEAWRNERRDALFLYAHVPFCEMRCGFCNLFTLARPPAALAARWLDRMDLEVDAALEALGSASFARFAIGGGTPTWLEVNQLERLLDGMSRLGADLAHIPGSVEVSPGTVTPEKIALLVERGATRISMGVQSLVEAETCAVYRPQDSAVVAAAVQIIRQYRPPVLNLDLIYGLPGQTVASWRESLSRLIEWEPEEIYCYPLYVRSQTGFGRHGGAAEDAHRLRLYRVGREVLLEAGYTQSSMRQFQRSSGPAGPTYRCQEDGMVGLGVGARSYTSRLHWSSQFAVEARGIRAIVEGWILSDPRRVSWGFPMDDAEERRRWVILSILSDLGVSRQGYEARYGDLMADFPQLSRLVDGQLATWYEGNLRLTPAGLEQSDAIGPWLISESVRRRMDAATVR